MPLTDQVIKQLKPKHKLYRVSDRDGLNLEVTPSGGKFWRIRYRIFRKPQMYSVGKYPAINLAQARKLCFAVRDLIEKGIHPTHEKKDKKRRQEISHADTLEKYALQWHADMSGDLSPKYASVVLTRLKMYVFPDLGHLHPTQVTKPDFVYVIRKIIEADKIPMAKSVCQIVSKLYRHLDAIGVCTHNPAANLKDIMPKRKKRHYACVKPSEFPALLQAMAARIKDITGMAMELLALTFVRTSELLGGMWQEIDWELSEWRIPAERMKMKEPHIVPLSRQAIAILRDLYAITGDTPFMFYSSASKGRHLTNMVILMALRRMGYNKRMTGHGFRALASTILNEMKVKGERTYDSDMIERQLAHKEKDEVKGAYDHAEYLEERKVMMQDYADMIDTMRETGKSVIDNVSLDRAV